MKWICHSLLRIDLNAQDLTEGDIPITSIVLKMRGEVWHSSGPIFQVIYQIVVWHYMDCERVFDIVLTATNQNGQTVTATRSIYTPNP